MTWEEFFWGEDQGYRYRSFNRTRFSFEFTQATRDLLSLIVGIQLLISYVMEGWLNFIFLTNWGLHLTFFSLVLNYRAAQDQMENPGQVTGFALLRWRLAVIVFKVAISMEVVLTGLFWALLWHTPKEYTFFHYFNITTHSFPLAFLVLDFFLQKWVFRYNHVWIVLSVALIYAIFNYSWVVAYGKPIYPILTWKDYGSVVLIGMALFMTYISHTFLYLLTQLNTKKQNAPQNIILYVPINLPRAYV